ncbi:MAG TPA: hypothetical protein VE111_00950 [Bradyrhizobium sp.]|nr:hypothetical protein [Bradyrhizobium sp.]
MLVGAERSDSAPDFFAKLTVTNRRRTRGRDELDRSFCLGGFIQRNGLKAAFGFRRLPGDGLNKRHSLRDQKIAFSLPLHSNTSARNHHSKKPVINQAANSLEAVEPRK